MGSSQDPNAHPPLGDPQAFQQFESNEAQSSFASLMNSTQPEASLAATHVPHIPSPLSSMFPSEVDPASTMQISMQMPMSAMSGAVVDMPQMDLDFSVQTSFSTDHNMAGLDGTGGNHALLSSPSATTGSTSVSHASSPSLNGVPSAFHIGSSSLASALDNTVMSRSRSGSSASPGLLTTAGSDHGASNGGSGPPSSAPSFGFPPPNDHAFSASKENSPEAPGDAHLMVLGDMLKNIAQQASSGSEACSMGQTEDARGIVDTLKKSVLLVADLIAAMQLRDGSVYDPSLSAQLGGGPSNGSNMASSLSSNGMDLGLQHLLNPPVSFSAPPSAPPEPNPPLDSSDMSRKRCASSVAGDRVQKALKLEPPDDTSLALQNPPSLGLHQSSHPTALPSSHTFSFPAHSAIPASMTSIAEQPSLPPSVPNSRPPSPSRMVRPSLGLQQDAQMSNPPLHPVVSFSHPMETVTHPSPEFTQLPPGNLSAPPMSVSSGFMAPPPSSSGWPDSSLSARHQHSLSASSIMSNLTRPNLNLANLAGSSSLPFLPGTGPYVSPTRSTHIPAPAAPIPPISATASGHGTLRQSRSSSFSHVNPFAFTVPDIAPPPPPIPEAMRSRPSTSGLHTTTTTRQSSPDDYDNYDNDADGEDGSDSSPPGYYSSSPPGDDNKQEGGDPSMEGVQSTHRPRTSRRMSRTSPGSEGGSYVSHTNEVPQEYRPAVERIFFEFLNKTCSNLDATDAKGEPIHQTLMAKKMQRLDESPDFRPFKFRIQAFTNAFLEELARQGYPEEKIPMKKIRNFLWNQPYISRFNEEGKKSKSKGNHIWHVDAKKTENGWLFRPFQRRLAGAPPGVAYIGLRWTWQPRIWDPQASRSNMPVTYSSPCLPSWLSWNDGALTGIPPPDAQSCDVTVEARFTQDGQEEVLSHTVHVSIAPVASVDTFVPSRRSSLVGDISNARRVLSDSAMPQNATPRSSRAPSFSSSVPNIVAPDSQVVQVLTTAAQRVAEEAQSQVVASPMDAGHELQALAKQQHVLTVTAQAFNNKGASDTTAGTSNQSSALAAAAQQVVLQAARQVVADRAVSGSPPTQAPGTQVTVKEVSVATQSAVAQAVEMVGPLSSEVDVLMTAKNLLQQQTRESYSPPQAVDPSQMAVPLDPVRPHSTGNMLQSPFPQSNSYYPHS
ncbi:unnamed protein product [Somion occarium]|uniref:Uncharacterized protein n=1 Tax=Somion occarium TaxID=3059160 RepID=A0ABP1D9P2_9APHY